MLEVIDVPECVDHAVAEAGGSPVYRFVDRAKRPIIEGNARLQTAPLSFN